MEVDDENTSEIKSLLASGAHNIIDFNKKRKLEAEQFGLPIPKHHCWNRSLVVSKPPLIFSANPELEELSARAIKGKTEEAADDGSETGSAKDSNSFSGDSDFRMSLHAEAKFEPEDVKRSLYCKASSLSSNWGSTSSDGTTVMNRGVDKEVVSPATVGLEPSHDDDALNTAENLEEPLVEYGSHIDYIYSGYGNYSMEQYHDKEIEENPYSSETNQNIYVLSSGRWSVNQEARQSTRKPTIDQEFEQYFSMLML